MKHERILGPRGDVEPVSTYREAIGWLFKYVSPREIEQYLDGGEISLVGRFICDTHWVTPQAFRKDVRTLWKAGGQ